MDDSQEKNVPDLYFDRVRISVSLYGVNIALGRSKFPPADDNVIDIETIGIARTSLTHAKVLAMLLAKNIKAFEAETETEIPIPDSTLEALGLDHIDW